MKIMVVTRSGGAIEGDVQAPTPGVVIDRFQKALADWANSQSDNLLRLDNFETRTTSFVYASQIEWITIYGSDLERLSVGDTASDIAEIQARAARRDAGIPVE